MKVSKLLYQPIATLVFFNLAACKKDKTEPGPRPRELPVGQWNFSSTNADLSLKNLKMKRSIINHYHTWK